MRKTLVCFITTIAISLSASAHALWMETETRSVKGKNHPVNIYFGEYSDNERDSVATWFSNLKNIEAFVTLPDGTKHQLELAAAVDHYVCAFVPGTDGVYTVSVSHTVADVYGESRIEYYATAAILVNTPLNKPMPYVTRLGLQPSLQETSKGKAITLQVMYDKAFAAGAKVVITTPEGWTKTLYTDKQGAVVFKPVNSGRYMLEAVKTDKIPGTHNGKSYKSVTHLVTHCIYVKP